MGNYYNKYLKNTYGSANYKQTAPSNILRSCDSCKNCLADDTYMLNRREYLFLHRKDFGGFMHFWCMHYQIYIYRSVFDEPKGSSNINYIYNNGSVQREWVKMFEPKREVYRNHILYGLKREY